MQTSIGDLCKLARKEAGLSQEEASERLYISVTTLAAIERGDRDPSPGMAGRMSDLYFKPMLGRQYLRHMAILEGHGIIPEIEDRPLPNSVLHLTNRIFAFADAHKDRTLMRIAEDGVIDESERQEFNSIVDDLYELIPVIMELRCR